MVGGRAEGAKSLSEGASFGHNQFGHFRYFCDMSHSQKIETMVTVMLQVLLYPN